MLINFRVLTFPDTNRGFWECSSNFSQCTGAPTAVCGNVIDNFGVNLIGNVSTMQHSRGTA